MQSPHRASPELPPPTIHEQPQPSSDNANSVNSSTQSPTAALNILQSTIQSANATKISLINQLHTLRDDLQASFQALSTEHQTQANAVERAARSVAVRAMELDNRALQLEHRESSLQATQARFDTEHTNRQAALDDASHSLSQRETALLAREASLKYSAVEQMRLHAWSRQLEKREARVGEAEDAEKERIVARVAAVARRELLVAEKERRADALFKDRETDVARREKVVDALAQSLERQRSEALLQIEAERSEFWTHQQKLSAVVAAETETLLAEQAKLRRQFEADSKAAKMAVREMMDQVGAMKQVLERARAEKLNGLCDGDIVEELAEESSAGSRDNLSRLEEMNIHSMKAATGNGRNLDPKPG